MKNKLSLTIIALLCYLGIVPLASAQCGTYWGRGWGGCYRPPVYVAPPIYIQPPPIYYTPMPYYNPYIPCPPVPYYPVYGPRCW